MPYRGLDIAVPCLPPQAPSINLSLSILPPLKARLPCWLGMWLILTGPYSWRLQNGSRETFGGNTTRNKESGVAGKRTRKISTPPLVVPAFTFVEGVKMETSELNSPPGELHLSCLIILLEYLCGFEIDRRRDEGNGIKWDHEVVPQPWAMLPLDSLMGLISCEAGVIGDSPPQIQGKGRHIKKIIQANPKYAVHQIKTPHLQGSLLIAYIFGWEFHCGYKMLNIAMVWKHLRSPEDKWQKSKDSEGQGSRSFPG